MLGHSRRRNCRPALAPTGMSMTRATSAWPTTLTTPWAKTTSIKVGLQAIDPNPDRPGDILMLNVDQPRSASVIRQGSGCTPPRERRANHHPHAPGQGRPSDCRESVHLLPELLAIDETTQGDAGGYAAPRGIHAARRTGRAGATLGRQHARAVPGGAGCRRPDCTGPGSPALLAADRRAAQRREYRLCHCERSVAIPNAVATAVRPRVFNLIEIATSRCSSQ